jgi:predicted PurR-regulated permease PerM
VSDRPGAPGRRAPRSAAAKPAPDAAARHPDGHVEQPGPTELRDPFIREELKRASVWFGLALTILAIVFLAQPLLLIFAAIVLASMLDGGTRLLGRWLPIGRGLRLALVTLAVVAFVLWAFYYSGSELAGQAERLRTAVTLQGDRVLGWAGRIGLVPSDINVSELTAQISGQLMGTLGKVGSAVSTAVGALTSLVMILVLGIFMATEPRLYQRGVAWMLPLGSRDSFYRTVSAMGHTLRRLMAGRLVGMAFEGVGTWLLLMIGGVPMAAVLGIITGLLAFLPNIGALISGILIILAGFSVSANAGLWAIFVYFFIQNVDSYLIVPYVARRAVDLPPALVLSAQILFGALFGILGVMLADPMLAMLKVALEQKSKADKVERAA